MTDKTTAERLREVAANCLYGATSRDGMGPGACGDQAAALDAIADEVEYQTRVFAEAMSERSDTVDEVTELSRRMSDNFTSAVGQIEKLQARVARLEGALKNCLWVATNDVQDGRCPASRIRKEANYALAEGGEA